MPEEDKDVRRSFRMSEDTAKFVEYIADRKFNGNETAALLAMVSEYKDEHFSIYGTEAFEEYVDELDSE